MERYKRECLVTALIAQKAWYRFHPKAVVPQVQQKLCKAHPEFPDTPEACAANILI